MEAVVRGGASRGARGDAGLDDDADRVQAVRAVLLPHGHRGLGHGVRAGEAGGGKWAKVLVDMGHHLPGCNIEHIVAFLIDEGMLGGFHLNDRKYADDDLGVGTIDAALNSFGRIDFALAAYNAGPGNVQKYGGIPLRGNPELRPQDLGLLRRLPLGDHWRGRNRHFGGGGGCKCRMGQHVLLIGYSGQQSGQIEAAMARIKGFLEEAKPQTPKEAVDQNTYMLAERARLMALTLGCARAPSKLRRPEGFRMPRKHCTTPPSGSTLRETFRPSNEGASRARRLCNASGITSSWLKACPSSTAPTSPRTSNSCRQHFAMPKTRSRRSKN